MLQVPTSISRHVAPIRLRAKSTRTKRAVSSLEKAIAEHKRAARIAENRAREKRALYAKFPALSDIRPLVHFWTKPDGKKCFGRSENDYNKIFHPSIDHISPGNVAGRKKFVEALDAARPEHQSRRRAVGIVDAENAAYLAQRDEIAALTRLINSRPKNRAEIARFSKYLIRVLKNYAGGMFFNVPSTKLEAMGGWKEYERRVHLTQGHLCRILYALARK